MGEEERFVVVETSDLERLARSISERWDWGAVYWQDDADREPHLVAMGYETEFGCCCDAGVEERRLEGMGATTARRTELLGQESLYDRGLGNSDGMEQCGSCLELRPAPVTFAQMTFKRLAEGGYVSQERIVGEVEEWFDTARSNWAARKAQRAMEKCLGELGEICEHLNARGLGAELARVAGERGAVSEGVGDLLPLVNAAYEGPVKNPRYEPMTVLRGDVVRSFFFYDAPSPYGRVTKRFDVCEIEVVENNGELVCKVVDSVDGAEAELSQSGEDEIETLGL